MGHAAAGVHLLKNQAGSAGGSSRTRKDPRCPTDRARRRPCRRPRPREPHGLWLRLRYGSGRDPSAKKNRHVLREEKEATPYKRDRDRMLRHLSANLSTLGSYGQH